MTELTDLSETDASNTTITAINIDEGCAPSGMNNAVRNTLGLIRRAFKSSIFRLRDSTDQTKLVALDLSGLTTATTRTLTVADANGTIITTAAAATQAEQEARSSLTTFVSPGRQENHPSAAKGWGIVNTAGSVSYAFNVTSVTDVGTGVIEVVWNTDFSGTSYSPFCQPIYTFGGTAATTLVVGINNTLAAGTSRFTCVNLSTFLATDPSFWSFVAYGDQ